ncbi:MAG TPA: hypothetical protein VFQ53_39765 [Kofleriaceae bacterium]|nr:hypothetical protein [Kofleriaceae bacterium]
MRTWPLALLCVVAFGCSKESLAPRSDPQAPLACLRKGEASKDLDLKRDYLVQLCSGATTATGPLDCYRAARRDASLDLSSEGALMLCSPFNLDAFNAQKKPAPTPPMTDGAVLQKLTAIESRLDAIERKLK